MSKTSKLQERLSALIEAIKVSKKFFFEERCVLDMRREFQVVVSNFELFCLSVRREIVVSTFYVFYLSQSLSECDKIDHMITCISQNEVGLLDIQTQI